MRVDLKWLVIGALVIIAALIIAAKIIGGRGAEVRQAEAGALSAEAMQEAGRAAVETVIKDGDRKVALTELVAEASKEIDDAPDPIAARAATLNAACELQLYRDDPACAVR